MTTDGDGPTSPDVEDDIESSELYVLVSEPDAAMTFEEPSIVFVELDVTAPEIDGTVSAVLELAETDPWLTVVVLLLLVLD